MRKKAIVRGTVTYLADNGMRRLIPKGDWEIEDERDDGRIILYWKNAAGKSVETELTVTKWAQYQVNEALRIEEPN